MTWLNSALNGALRFATSRAFRRHEVYPAASTALLLVDAQKGLLTNQAQIRQLTRLAAAIRAVNARVFFSQYDPGESHDFVTQAHQQLVDELGGAGNASISHELGPEASDIVLEPRRTLSALADERVVQSLTDQGVEHLVLAGPLALTTLDSTMRDAAQHDLHVTVVDLFTGTQETADSATRMQFKYTMPRYAQTVCPLPRFLRRLEKSNVK